MWRRNFDAGLGQHRHNGGLDRVQNGVRARYRGRHGQACLALAGSKGDYL
jgi:hypothetical protein